MNDKRGAVQEIRDVVALGASLVGVVYLSGVLIVGLRLGFERLPPFAAVGSIPKETAITIGLVQVFAPAVVSGAVFLVWITTWIKEPKSHYKRFNQVRGRLRRRLVGTVVSGAILTALPGFAVSLSTYDGVHPAHLAVVASLAIGALMAAGYIHLRARVRERGTDAKWKSQSSMLLRAGLFAVATIPAFIALDAAIPLPHAHVCFRPDNAGTSIPLNGWFVTQTSDRVYVGDSGKGPRLLHVLLSDVVGEVTVGKTASKAKCQISPA